jgi:hypothetical protein
MTVLFHMGRACPAAPQHESLAGRWNSPYATATATRYSMKEVNTDAYAARENLQREGG